MKSAILTFYAILLTVVGFGQFDVTPYLSEVKINNNPIQILRIPEDKMPASIKNDISGAQRLLDRCRKWHDEGGLPSYTDRNQMQWYKDFVTNREPEFPFKYYLNEHIAFMTYADQYEQFREDGVKKEKARYADSIRFAEQVEGYTFINPPFVLVKEKPSAASMTIGKLYRGSYVRSFEVENDKSGYIEIHFQNYEYKGYIKEDDIVFDFEEFDPPAEPELLQSLNNWRYTKFEISPAYKAKLEKAEAAEERARNASGPKRRYIRGPKGGCYFINSKGNKEYVDHSFCK